MKIPKILGLIASLAFISKSATAACPAASFPTSCTFPVWIDDPVKINEVHTYADGSIWFLTSTVPSNIYFKIKTTAPATDAGIKT